ncbi:MAG: hypothetical protein KatS3mg121_0965 [Gammaproteobacteria bacterium]|nr:MAG: hypothetical protein KatS3mg121_0965 [Gammaproteobacteria bacterium]
MTGVRRILGLLLLAGAAGAWAALDDDPPVRERPRPGDFPLVGPRGPAPLWVDAADLPGVGRAAGDLAADIERVTGRRPALGHDAPQGAAAVLIGTLGHSRLIDALAAAGRLPVETLHGRWEAYHVAVVEAPLPGLERALVIAGSDRRGTIYGVYTLSEAIGVSPWYDWADVPVRHRRALYLPAGTRLSDAPRVRYRGIFINDEAPALTGWVKAHYGDYDHRFYRRVFELLLRLKANLLWPAMWNNAFADDDPENPRLAHEYGIVMGTSHHEPMMRADKEWNRHGRGPWQYSTNREAIYAFWEEGARRAKPYDSIFTLGMRGQEDRPLSEGENIELLQRIVADQREILARVFGAENLTRVPQVWTLYKEVQGFYERGMRVPDDVTLIWSDDNWGNLRRVPTAQERRRSGGAGVYYHLDYVGGPRSYRWIGTVHIAKIQEQMNLAWAFGADRLWIVNVGDIKPMEFPMEFFLRLAWDPEAWPAWRLPEYTRRWAAREFGAEHAADIAALIDFYTRHNQRRKPELQDQSSYSLLAHREAERVEAELQDALARASALEARLAPAWRDAYVQLVGHPVAASANLTLMYIAQARNHLFAEQRRAETERWARVVLDRFAEDARLTERYHRLRGGKWRHMMDQPHIGYLYWNNPPENVTPVTAHYRPHLAPDMGVAIEGQARAWPVPGPYRLSFTRFGQPTRRIEVFNRGRTPFTARIETDADWIRLDRETFTVADSVPVEIGVDWTRLPPGRHRGWLTVHGASWGPARIEVVAEQPPAALVETARGFLEGDGVVAIDAAHYQARGAADGLDWVVLPGFGRRGSALTTLPAADRFYDDPAAAPWVEYEFTLFEPGERALIVELAPTQRLFPDRGLRYAVAFDGGPPRILDALEGYDQAAWERAVIANLHRHASRHRFARAGVHRLRLWRLDPGLTVERLILHRGELPPSLLGPPESAYRP